MKNILVVGQTPPPYGGQAMMIQYMLDGKYENMRLYHVRMSFSRGLEERGKFSVRKILHIFVVILSIWKSRISSHIDIMYYPLSSAPKIALLRDVIILGCTRFLFRQIIYHFHAAGVSEELPKYPSLLRKLCYFIIQKPDLGITSSEFNPDDADYLKAKKSVVIPLGIPDENENKIRQCIGERHNLNILFMGLLNSTKGEGYILEAVHILDMQEIKMELYLAGEFETDEYKKEFFEKVKQYGLGNRVHYVGVVKDKNKRDLFLNCDVFCFPSFFSSESFGIVLLESMMYQMPLIASKWRGVQSVVCDGDNGFLVEIKDAKQIANKLSILNRNRNLLKEMAANGRRKFENEYSLSVYLECMEKALVSL